MQQDTFLPIAGVVLNIEVVGAGAGNPFPNTGAVDDFVMRFGDEILVRVGGNRSGAFQGTLMPRDVAVNEEQLVLFIRLAFLTAVDGFLQIGFGRRHA